MKQKDVYFFIVGMLVGFSCSAQQNTVGNGNTLLWKISGKDLQAPSYLFGTVHVLCVEDARLSSNARTAIQDVDEVYFETDLDDAAETMSAVQQMSMKDGITLKSLLSAGDYAKVAAYFEKSGQGALFSVMQNFKPLVLATLMQVKGLGCQKTTAMEMVIMKEAAKYQKEIKGLETMAFQLAIFDSIPYEVQAKQLLDVVNQEYDVNGETIKLMQAYKNQDLRAIDSITHDKKWGIEKYEDILIYKRNENWVQQLRRIMAQRPVLVAVGAGHLPGPKGLLRLLTEAGYKVEPLNNRN